MSQQVHTGVSEGPGVPRGGGGLVAQSCSTLGTPWTAARQAPLSMEFSRPEYWSRQPFPSPGDLPAQGWNPGLLHCRRILYRPSHQWACGPWSAAVLPAPPQQPLRGWVWAEEEPHAPMPSRAPARHRLTAAVRQGPSWCRDQGGQEALLTVPPMAWRASMGVGAGRPPGSSPSGWGPQAPKRGSSHRAQGCLVTSFQSPPRVPVAGSVPPCPRHVPGAGSLAL